VKLAAGSRPRLAAWSGGRPRCSTSIRVSVHALRPYSRLLSRIIVHLAAVTFMDCRSVRELISVRAPVQQAGSGLLLAGLQPMVRRLFYHLDLIGLLPVFAGAEEAVNGCQEPSWQPFGECPPAPSERVPGLGGKEEGRAVREPLPMPRTTGQRLVALGAAPTAALGRPGQQG
jgi:anti-anti-sigma factor